MWLCVSVCVYTCVCEWECMCVCVCDLESSTMRRLKPESGRCYTEKKIITVIRRALCLKPAESIRFHNLISQPNILHTLIAIFLIYSLINKPPNNKEYLQVKSVPS